MLYIFDNKGRIYYGGERMEGSESFDIQEFPEKEGMNIERIDVSGDTPTPVYTEVEKTKAQIMEEKLQAQEETIQMLTGCMLEMSETLYA